MENAMLPGEITRSQLSAIASKHKVSLDDILSDRVTSRICRARNEAVKFLYENRGFKVTQIGRAFNRHHSTILHILGMTPKAKQREGWRASQTLRIATYLAANGSDLSSLDISHSDLIEAKFAGSTLSYALAPAMELAKEIRKQGAINDQAGIPHRRRPNPIDGKGSHQRDERGPQAD